MFGRIWVLTLLVGCSEYDLWFNAIHEPCDNADAYLEKYDICIFYDTAAADLYKDEELSPEVIEKTLDVIHNYGIRKLLGLDVSDHWLRYFYSNHGARIRFNENAIHNFYENGEDVGGAIWTTPEDDKFAIVLRSKYLMKETAIAHEFLHAYQLMIGDNGLNHLSIDNLFACLESPSIKKTIEDKIQQEICYSLYGTGCYTKPAICK